MENGFNLLALNPSRAHIMSLQWSVHSWWNPERGLKQGCLRKDSNPNLSQQPGSTRLSGRFNPPAKTGVFKPSTKQAHSTPIKAEDTNFHLIINYDNLLRLWSTFPNCSILIYQGEIYLYIIKLIPKKYLSDENYCWYGHSKKSIQKGSICKNPIWRWTF